MNLFRLLLLIILAGVGSYTVMVIAQDGLDFITPFNSAIAAVGWQGQFNLDLLGMFALGAVWIAYRHGFSGTGLVLAIGPFLLGVLYFACYLLIASLSARDAQELFSGVSRPQPS